MVVFSGRNVEEAIEKGLHELNLPRLKAHIRVITREKKGFLGFGKKLAQVEIKEIATASEDNLAISNYQADLTSIADSKEVLGNVAEQSETLDKTNRSLVEQIEESKQDNKVEMVAFTSNTLTETLHLESQDTNIQSDITPTVEDLDDSVSTEQTPLVNSDSSEQSFEEFVASEFSEDTSYKNIERAAQDVLAYVEKIIYEMDLEASIEASHNRRQINLQIETPEAGRVIGYHGKVLKSIQLLAQNFLHDRYSKNFSVVLNVHDYIEHRTETLIEFTKKAVKRVQESGKDYLMDPMSNSERKLVHKTVSQIEGVTSYSEGDDPNRYVVVTLKD